MNKDQNNASSGDKYRLFKELYAQDSYSVKEREFVELKEKFNLTDVFLLSSFWESGM